MRSGDLTTRASFCYPVLATDLDFNQVQAYPEAFSAWVNLRPLRGGESVMQARMQAKNPAIVTFRASRASREVTSEWRVLIDGRTYEVKEDPRETQDRAFLEVLVETIDPRLDDASRP